MFKIGNKIIAYRKTYAGHKFGTIATIYRKNAASSDFLVALTDVARVNVSVMKENDKHWKLYQPECDEVTNA